MKRIPHCLTARLKTFGIRSLINLSNPGRPIGYSVLYLRRSTPDAAPKCISGRTSYLRVRLAFHPYPQLIRAVFNRHRFGPPRGITPASTWPWVDHAVSGLTHATKAQGHALFGLAFAAPPRLTPLRLATYVNSQAHSAKGTPSPVPGKPGIGLRLLVGDAVSGTISLPSRGAFHLSLTVLVHYRSLESI